MDNSALLDALEVARIDASKAALGAVEKTCQGIMPSEYSAQAEFLTYVIACCLHSAEGIDRRLAGEIQLASEFESHADHCERMAGEIAASIAGGAS